jgi:hypothetical protein
MLIPPERGGIKVTKNVTHTSKNCHFPRLRGFFDSQHVYIQSDRGWHDWHGSCTMIDVMTVKKLKANLGGKNV